MNLKTRKAMAAHLRDKTGYSISKFAKLNKVARQSVYDALGGGGSRRIRVEIAKSMQIPPSMIWADNNLITKTVDDLHYLGCAND